MASREPKPNDTCPLCGGPNGCAPAASGSFDTPCWCTTTRIDPAALARIPDEQRNQACICRNCATGATSKSKMTLHIGIVACSAEGAALCYRTICAEGAQLLGPHAHPEVSMHTPSLSDYVACLERGDLQGVGELMLGSARKLAAIGADFLICPDNTIHQALPLIEARSPLPWLHIADAVADEAVARGYRRIGITGTRWLVDSDVYPGKLAARGLDWLRPGPEQRDEINRIIMDELVYGVFKPESVAYFQRVIAWMEEAGCDAVVLGCTEIPLIIHDGNSPLPTLDSARLLARAALRRAMREA